jgi:osmotically-inducible protein OsmY
MSKVRTILFALAAVIGISFVTANAQNFAAADSSSRSIDEQIYRKLKGADQTVFDHITWQVNGNTVTLSGKAYSLGIINRAKAIVKDIPSITEVVNNIEQLPPSTMDDRIRREALIEIQQRGPSQYFGYPNPDVHLIVENGRITLEGYVARKSDSDLLNILSNGISGVFKVTNNLIVGKRNF